MRQPLLAVVLGLSLFTAGCSWPGHLSGVAGQSSSTEACTEVVVAGDPSTPGITLAAIPPRVRQIASGSLPSDVVARGKVAGPQTTWNLVRGSTVVASATFDDLPRGWVLDSASSCAAGITLRP